MTKEERDEAVASYNQVQAEASRMRNTLRTYVGRAQAEQSMCGSGRHECYENMNLTANGVREPESRYDYTAPQETPQTLEHEDWYNVTGLRGMVEEATAELTAYKEQVKTWLTKNWRRAVTRDFAEELFTALDFGDLPPEPKNVVFYVEYRYSMPAGAEITDESVKAQTEEFMGTLTKDAVSVDNSYVSVSVFSGDDD